MSAGHDYHVYKTEAELEVEVAPRHHCPALGGAVLPTLHSTATYLNPMHGHYISGINYGDDDDDDDERRSGKC